LCTSDGQETEPPVQRSVTSHEPAARAADRAGRSFAAQKAPIGVIAVAQSAPVGVAIEDLVLVAECSSSEEWRDQVRHIPLR